MPSRELSTSVMSGSCPTVGPDWVAARVREPAAPELLLLDCRPPEQFARCRLRGALGVSLPASLIVLRRLSNGKLCVSSVLRDARQRDAFEACYRQLPIVLYDADGSYADAQVTGVLVQRLRQDGCQVSCLQGGFSEFHSRYPEWCDSGEPQEPTVSTSSSPPGSAGTTTPGPVSVTTTRALLGLETLRISTECGSPKDPREDPDRCDSGLARDDSPGGADPPFPVQIVPFLYLGNEENSLDLDSLERHNIRYVLNVTHNLANAFEGRGLKYMKIPIEDHWSQNLASFFPQAIAFIGDMPSAASGSSTAQRRPRKRFRIDEDLCLLREVASADPYNNPQAWDDILRNVILAVQRDLTLRAIKERVDLLVGYFRQQDSVNLRKSGTEEQYGEREILLQDISDLMRSASYVPRTVPRKGSGTGTRPSAATLSAAARQRLARDVRDSATALMSLPDGGEANDGVVASDMLMAIYNSHNTEENEASEDGPAEASTRPSQQLCATNQSPQDPAAQEPPGQEPATQGPAGPEQAAAEESDFDNQAGPVQAQKRRQTVRAGQIGIRGLQGMGVELLSKREDHEFIVRQKEIELQHRKLDYDERRLALEERKISLFEERLQSLEFRIRRSNEEMLDSVKNMLELHEKKMTRLLRKRSRTSEDDDSDN